MLVRLGFAVAVHVEPDVLLIDEVLAVGDEAFQAKCLDRVREFQREGRTIVLVTHALDTVIEICDRAAMLHHGELHAIGMPGRRRARDAVRPARRDRSGLRPRGGHARGGDRRGPDRPRRTARARAPSCAATRSRSRSTSGQNEPVDDLDVDFAVLDGATNHPVLDARTSRGGSRSRAVRRKKRVRFRIEAFPYEPGKYWVTVGLQLAPTGHLYHVQTQRYLFEVVRRAPRAGARRGPGGRGGRGPVLRSPRRDPIRRPSTKGIPSRC